MEICEFNETSRIQVDGEWPKYSVSCVYPMIGRHVRIQILNLTVQYLELCEVNVFGLPAFHGKLMELQNRICAMSVIISWL